MHNNFAQETVPKGMDILIEDLEDPISGGEATVYSQHRNYFPGIGGTIMTNQQVDVALRESFNTAPKVGHQTFLKHALIKKLEDFFVRTKCYTYAHIARPLGSISYPDKEQEGYLYEWADGHEGFMWTFSYGMNERGQVELDEWNKFSTLFTSAGIKLGWDVTDQDSDGMSKNIIHRRTSTRSNVERLDRRWKRIDFGPQSAPIQFDKVTAFLNDNQAELIEILEWKRFHMLELIVEYLQDPNKMREVDIGRLEILVGDYRSSTCRHLKSSHSSETDPVDLIPGDQFLID